MNDDFPLQLEEQLCFNLYATTNAISHLYKQHLDKINITFPQYLVILALRGKPLANSGELAKELHLDPGTLSPILKRLVAAGLITRVRHEEDHRVVYSELTPAGLALGDDMIKAQAAVIRQVNMTESDQDALRQTLKDVAKALTTS